jgi:hypothetical protein
MIMTIKPTPLLKVHKTWWSHLRANPGPIPAQRKAVAPCNSFAPTLDCEVSVRQLTAGVAHRSGTINGKAAPAYSGSMVAANLSQ